MTKLPVLPGNLAPLFVFSAKKKKEGSVGFVLNTLGPEEDREVCGHNSMVVQKPLLKRGFRALT